MGDWNFDIQKTQQRAKSLSCYYIEQGLNADAFTCKFFDMCAASQKPGTTKQYSGGTAGLMPFYDVTYKGKEIRILVVGKETGYMLNSPYGTSPNFNENNRNVLNCINWKGKNNHIKGTLITLQKIYGFESEYLYASFALSNALRCAFQISEKIKNVSNVQDTKTMRKNCLEHLLAEIKILEPTLIITQGEWAIKGNKNFIEVLEEALNVSKAFLKASHNGKYGLYQFPSFMLIAGHHPAILGNWVKNLAPDSLWPMIDYLRIIEYLPKFSSNSRSEYELLVTHEVDNLLRDAPSNDRLRKNYTQDSVSQLHFFDD
jgi:hypothetical protein